jgi:hypothetical protein
MTQDSSLGVVCGRLLRPKASTIAELKADGERLKKVLYAK